MKIVLAYSGGLDTSVLLSWIKEKLTSYQAVIGSNQGGYPMFEINLQGNTGKMDMRQSGVTSRQAIPLKKSVCHRFLSAAARAVQV